MKKFLFYPVLLFLITVCSVPLSGKSTLPNSSIINMQGNTPPQIPSCAGYLIERETYKAHIEGRYLPLNDPTLKLEIFFNRKLVEPSFRHKIIFDSGFFALEISNLVTEDSGIYTFRFTNNLGTANATCTLKVIEKN